jgi:hypothetical protein
MPLAEKLCATDPVYSLFLGEGVFMRSSIPLILLLAAACGDDGVNRLPDAPIAPDTPIAPDAPSCSAPTGAGTMHGMNVMADETWTAAASPHIVTTSIGVRGATLTIEPCAVVRIRAGHFITVGQTPGGAPAALVAHGGDSTREIKFERDDPAMPWASIRAFPTGTVDFEHVRLSGGSDPATAQQGGGTIIGAGAGGNMGLTPNVRVVDVTIENSAGFGVNIQTRAAFSADSANLTITGAAAVPLTVEGAAVSTIPTGSYTGNALDAIRVANASNLLDSDIAFRARGVPYHMADSFSMSPMTSAAAGGLSTLTIEAGVTIKFNNGGASADYSLGLGASNGITPANIFPVRLVAQGTAAQPIILTSSSATPAAGDWTGLEWHGGPPDGNVMSHVRIEYAGDNSGTQGFGCGQADNDAALIIRNWRPDNAFITDSTFASSAAGGIVSGWQTDLGGPSLVGNNTFTSIANGCNVSRWRDGNNSCPGMPPICL